MPKRLPFHIQHNTTPNVVAKIVRLASDENLSLESLSVELGYGKGTTAHIVPFLRQMGVLDGWWLSGFGERLKLLFQSRPDLLAEAVHVHLYTLHWLDPKAYFSFAYSKVCDWLWEREVWRLDGKGIAQLVGVVVEAAGKTYGVDVSQIAFSANSVRGVLHWLRALEPPVIAHVSGETFQRRASCPIPSLLWCVDAFYRHPQWRRDYGVRMQLDEERLMLLSKVCLLDFEGLEKTLAMAERFYDYRRGEGFFGIGTEGGFGRWLILTKPFPVGSI